jgi:hypothetical protein
MTLPSEWATSGGVSVGPAPSTGLLPSGWATSPDVVTTRQGSAVFRWDGTTLVPVDVLLGAEF